MQTRESEDVVILTYRISIQNHPKPRSSCQNHAQFHPFPNNWDLAIPVSRQNCVIFRRLYIRGRWRMLKVSYWVLQMHGRILPIERMLAVLGQLWPKSLATFSPNMSTVHPHQFHVPFLGWWMVVAHNGGFQISPDSATSDLELLNYSTKSSPIYPHDPTWIVCYRS